MSGFSIRYPFFIIMLCLIITVVGITTVARMPVDLFPDINIPVVVVATFYSGMPPEQIEANITNPFERFFTLGSGIDHIESRSLTGVSLIKIYFQPGTNPDAAVSGISNLAMAQLRRLTAGDAASRRAEVRRFQFAGVPDHVEGRRSERDGVARPWAVHGSQPDCECARSIRAAALRRQVPADSGLCRSRKVAGASVEPDGCGAHRERCQHDPACRRCAHRSERLQHLHQQPTADDGRDQPSAVEVRGQRRIDGGRRRLRQGRSRHTDQHRAGGRATIRLSSDPQARRKQQHHRHRQRNQEVLEATCSTCRNRW